MQIYIKPVPVDESWDIHRNITYDYREIERIINDNNLDNWENANCFTDVNFSITEGMLTNFKVNIDWDKYIIYYISIPCIGKKYFAYVFDKNYVANRINLSLKIDYYSSYAIENGKNNIFAGETYISRSNMDGLEPEYNFLHSENCSDIPNNIENVVKTDSIVNSETELYIGSYKTGTENKINYPASQFDFSKRLRNYIFNIKTIGSWSTFNNNIISYTPLVNLTKDYNIKLKLNENKWIFKDIEGNKRESVINSFSAFMYMLRINLKWPVSINIPININDWFYINNSIEPSKHFPISRRRSVSGNEYFTELNRIMELFGKMSNEKAELFRILRDSLFDNNTSKIMIVPLIFNMQEEINSNNVNFNLKIPYISKYILSKDHKNFHREIILKIGDFEILKINPFSIKKDEIFGIRQIDNEKVIYNFYEDSDRLNLIHRIEVDYSQPIFNNSYYNYIKEKEISKQSGWYTKPLEGLGVLLNLLPLGLGQKFGLVDSNNTYLKQRTYLNIGIGLAQIPFQFIKSYLESSRVENYQKIKAKTDNKPRYIPQNDLINNIFNKESIRSLAMKEIECYTEGGSLPVYRNVVWDKPFSEPIKEEIDNFKIYFEIKISEPLKKDLDYIDYDQLKYGWVLENIYKLSSIFNNNNNYIYFRGRINPITNKMNNFELVNLNEQLLSGITILKNKKTKWIE